MKQITCPHCGDNYPDFDVAHVCSKGPYAPKLKPKMNERIRELHNLACRIDMEQHPGAIPDGERIQQKFAELIIEDACRALNPMLRDMISRGQAVELIKKHFGVEQ
jgi:hypothetical protein